MKSVNLDRNALVVRHNKLIESRHKLTLVERKFILWMISQTSREDEVLKTYKISVQEWAEFCGIEERGSIYKEALLMVEKLATRAVGIHNEKRATHTFYPWFGVIKYAYGEGYIEAKLNENIESMFLDLSREFTSISLEYALLLNSVYAGRIYDLLKQYAKIGERIVTISDLKAMLEINDKYSLFADFRRNVIEVAEREINTKTDIHIDWKPIKEGRKVVAICFTIKTKKPTARSDSFDIQDTFAKKLFEHLVMHGVKKATAHKLISKYDNERVQWHLDAVENALKNGKNIPNVAGWLVDGIKKDYRSQKNLFLEKQQKESETRKEELRKMAMIEDHAAAIRDEIRLANRRRVRAKIAELTGDEKADFEDVFLKEMQAGTAADQMAAEAFLRSGLQEPIAAVSYEMKIREHFPEILLDEITIAQKRGVDTAVIKVLKKK